MRQFYDTMHHTNRLEAYTPYFKWYPDQNSIPNRNVEGFCILTDMPYIGRNHRGIIKHLEPLSSLQIIEDNGCSL